MLNSRASPRGNYRQFAHVYEIYCAVPIGSRNITDFLAEPITCHIRKPLQCGSSRKNNYYTSELMSYLLLCITSRYSLAIRSSFIESLFIYFFFALTQSRLYIRIYTIPIDRKQRFQNVFPQAMRARSCR